MTSYHTHLSMPGVVLLVAAILGGVACSGGPRPYNRVERRQFNQAAVRLNLPLMWSADDNGNGVVEPGEVVSLLFYPTTQQWVHEGSFTPAFASAYEQIAKEAARTDVDGAGLTEEERERRRLVRQDLDYGIATLVYNDLRQLPADHKKAVMHLLNAAGLIDTLYARQTGAERLAPQVPADDPASQSMFRRNWGPRGRAPATERNPTCSAIPGAPTPLVDAYPAELQEEEDFCQLLAQQPMSEELTAPFTVVRQAGDGLEAEPLNEAYGQEMGAIASELRAAAAALKDPQEDALRSYLEAAATAFDDNDWEPADEAWAQMNANNSRWYLRIAPDEVYWDPCAFKAGFHMTMALINRASLAWQERLTPVRQEMEHELASLIGKPYTQRTVSFQLPDFIDIVVNAGDDRNAFGATIGQSLPNWGPVANEGRGRTVAMSNLYTDADSVAIRRAMASSLLDAETMAWLSDSPEPGLLGTILHEATHNLGPSHEYRVNGMTDTEAFGGGLASVLEELKAQSGALWYLELLSQRGVITTEMRNQAWADALVWTFGHISRGMYTADGHPKAYSQLAAIQVGFLLEQGAVRFDKELPAANGKDTGAFTIDLERFPAAVTALMETVGQIKAKGDRKAAEQLRTTMVDGDAVPQQLIAERVLRYPKASFVYALDL